MEIKQLVPMDKVLTFFGEFKSATVESTIKGIVKHSSRGHLHREDYVNGGGIVAHGAKVRKAYRNTTFMIHQVSGLSFGTPRSWYTLCAQLKIFLKRLKILGDMIFILIFASER